MRDSMSGFVTIRDCEFLADGMNPFGSSNVGGSSPPEASELFVTSTVAFTCEARAAVGLFGNEILSVLTELMLL